MVTLPRVTFMDVAVWTLVGVVAIGTIVLARRLGRHNPGRASTQADEERAQAVSTLSHELRSSLNAIVGWTCVLKQNQAPETVAKALEVIERNCRRQVQLLDRFIQGDARAKTDGLAVSDEAPPAPARSLHAVSVLVLDDERDCREVVQQLLEDAGAHVRTVQTAEDALAQIRSGFVPDLILSDISMPGSDGYEFMRSVRGMSGPVAAVPAAALTALARVSDRKRALLAGFQTYLLKPIDPAALLATVARLTGRSRRLHA
jgi:CheY-like chemotaxis protein